jgi:mannose/fructose-specific phosphotransferase system component IIA
VNLPMLLEVLLADDDEPSSLASLADRIGREGIVNVTAALLRAPPEPSGGDST